MNFLAHLYLSGDKTDIRIGGFIADFIKGNNFQEFSEEIKSGIILHRQIDTFTDNHKLVKKGKVRLQEKYRKYAGIVLDIFYDHFLAINWDLFSNQTLSVFTKDIYIMLVLNYYKLPAGAKKVLPFMIIGNWLESYKKIEMIEQVLIRMSLRTSLPNEAEFGIKILREHYQSFNQEFKEFIIELEAFILSLKYL